VNQLLETRSAYDGQPARAWVDLNVAGRAGRRINIKAVADTGSPFSLVISHAVFQQCRRGKGPPAITNFGVLEAAWADIRVPRLQFTERMLIYTNDDVISAIERSSRDFSALIGLPFLRRFEYGGNATDFWLRLDDST
jgi:hypothetical protein